ncbi:MAG TPA: AbrB/MazE/SpoVT family DNA-binding domain-containing protein [Clostridiales bacterium]|jgi:antitoxin MazE|nr:AbrB/MazE/SpoVT family DNA-binding domain-containing protein [Clostridiales bacterium]HQP69875.1 AbrB/MazE/SpoVT family DNA-binding domain-containing protein [Clostridiales bacterium]
MYNLSQINEGAVMQMVIKKWGNSLGLIIPKIIANDLDIKDGTSVEVQQLNGNIVISPKRYKLSDLLDKIDESNKHEVTDFGKAEGKEAW